jgi:hypothetical protein
MVMQTSHEPTPTYVMFDNGGAPIGEVVQPKQEPVLGRGEGTVLLLRERSKS